MPDLMIHILELSPFFSRKKFGRHINQNHLAAICASFLLAFNFLKYSPI